mmetsp:Transcript_6203/g.13685  ORF Transcript_6203/g.13685 Transcript_6203/m.13685 type:complete len:397 (+) Transcript_6203:158-1348(+)
MPYSSRGATLLQISGIAITIMLLLVLIVLIEDTLDFGRAKSISGPGGVQLRKVTPQERSKRPKIAYAITVTKDGPFVDGALVLGYAAKKYHSAVKGFPSDYDVELVAFATPTVNSSIAILERFGWRVLQRPLPVAIDQIENQQYAQKMRNSGCCGVDEFLKLWAYTLTEYHRVVHLDMDSIVLKNLDELFSVDKELLFTGDYNMKGRCKYAPVQGGFLVIKPSIKTFEEFRAIIRKGNHGPAGWEGSHIGNFWGGQTIQGIMPYVYKILKPDDALELNRCVYNCMVDNPYRKNTLICQDGKTTCQDCRLQTPEKVSSAHFTICGKPWTCTKHTNPRNNILCGVLHKKWFALRGELEADLGIDTSYRKANSPFKDSLGMCQRYGDKYYLPVPLHLIK